MGSVTVRWEGTCRDRALQEELASFLRELADRSAARRERPAPKRPKIMEVMTAQRQRDVVPLEPIRTFDQELTGAIVLDPCLARDGQSLHDDVQRTQVEMVTVEAGGTEKAEPFCLSLGSSGAQVCLRLPRLGAYGIDFQLFDPRGLYPDADRMSFVFLKSPLLSSLDGCLAQIENREQCRSYPSEVIRNADWYVSAPNIHLRYYLEEWSDFLLVWVKYFFIPDLFYCRYEDMQQYEATKTIIAENRRNDGDEGAKRAVFRMLMAMFEAEANAWIQKLGNME